MKDKEFAKLIKSADPEIQVYLNKILQTVSDKKDFSVVME